jgi:hypothetical protein
MNLFLMILQIAISSVIHCGLNQPFEGKLLCFSASQVSVLGVSFQGLSSVMLNKGQAFILLISRDLFSMLDILGYSPKPDCDKWVHCPCKFFTHVQTVRETDFTGLLKT